jgi:hypothetical protein
MKSLSNKAGCLSPDGTHSQSSNYLAFAVLGDQRSTEVPKTVMLYVETRKKRACFLHSTNSDNTMEFFSTAHSKF